MNRTMRFPALCLVLCSIACGDKELEPELEDTSVEVEDTAPEDTEVEDTEVEDTGEEAVDADGDGVTEQLDCDDNDPTVSPLAEEICDGKDNDCDGDVPMHELDLTGDGVRDCEAVECDAMSMTWGMADRDEDMGTVAASCHAETGSCDAYGGDASCSEPRRVLCVLNDGSENPGYGNWMPGESALTGPIAGCQLTSSDTADILCEKTFGSGWRMAEFHMGGGWSFWSYGDWETDERFAVSINNKAANCWD